MLRIGWGIPRKLLKASLIKQILAGLVLGILLAAFSLPQQPRQAFSVRCS